MGSGKSTIAHLLSESTDLPYFDLDKIIEEREQKTIPELFSEKGEIYFRKLESQILKEMIQKEEAMILSLGGGTPCYAGNHLLLNEENVISVYLKASIDSLYNRLVEHKTNRPLIAEMSESEMKEFIAKHLFDRSYYYHHAKHTVVTDDKELDAIVATIKELT